jgi:hypothetical protein
VKKILLALVAAAVTVAIAVPVAFGGSSAVVMTQCANPLPGLSGCQFNFFDGTGNMTTYNPTAFNDVITPSGNENEHFEGTISNNTGNDVIYNAGTPLTAGDTCYSFATTHKTLDWQLAISASGAYTLDCHFQK